MVKRGQRGGMRVMGGGVLLHSSVAAASAMAAR